MLTRSWYVRGPSLKWKTVSTTFVAFRYLGSAVYTPDIFRFGQNGYLNVIMQFCISNVPHVQSEESYANFYQT